MSDVFGPERLCSQAATLSSRHLSSDCIRAMRSSRSRLQFSVLRCSWRTQRKQSLGSLSYCYSNIAMACRFTRIVAVMNTDCRLVQVHELWHRDVINRRNFMYSLFGSPIKFVLRQRRLSRRRTSSLHDIQVRVPHVRAGRVPLNLDVPGP